MNEKQSMDIFEKAPVSTAVLKNAVPAMAAMLMVLVYNLADTFFIGQTHDDLQVAAVSLATPVFLIFMSVGTVFGIGGTSVISRAMGEGRPEYAKRVCSFCMWSCVAVGLVMSALFLIFMDQILWLVGASADTWHFARTYLTIVSLSGPFVLIANCYSNVIRAEGRSGTAMMGQLLGNLLNVVLDPIMILAFGWEIAGAAIATVIGNVVGAGYYILYFLRGKIHPQHPSAGLSSRREGVHRSAGHRHPGLPGLLADERFPDRGQCPDDRLRRYGGGRHRRCHEGDHDDRHDLHWLWPRHPTADRILCGRGALGAAESIHALFSQTRRRLDTRWLLPASY